MARPDHGGSRTGVAPVGMGSGPDLDGIVTLRGVPFARLRPSMRRNGLIGVAVLVLFAGGLALSAIASATSDSIQLTGPARVRYRSHFKLTITGYGADRADWVITGYNQRRFGGTVCRSTIKKEAALGGWTELQKYGGGPVIGHFTFVISYRAGRVTANGGYHHGRSTLCTYLINLTTNRTYAYASKSWTTY
jgi:hypothetical protein